MVQRSTRKEQLSFSPGITCRGAWPSAFFAKAMYHALITKGCGLAAAFWLIADDLLVRNRHKARSL